MRIAYYKICSLIFLSPFFNNFSMQSNKIAEKLLQKKTNTIQLTLIARKPAKFDNFDIDIKRECRRLLRNWQKGYFEFKRLK